MAHKKQNYSILFNNKAESGARELSAGYIRAFYLLLYSIYQEATSKLVLRNPHVVEMITITLIGLNAASLYVPRPTEGADGSKYDIVYAANVSPLQSVPTNTD
ncbi:hypothetical protein BDC45DRAFT_559841 [Circinella umbellata]|nr:hypothetical protein BDC45DRAFT_559841 [Circinella umbellata]